MSTFEKYIETYRGAEIVGGKGVDTNVTVKSLSTKGITIYCTFNFSTFSYSTQIG